jgi:hypothetical protein
VWLVGRLFHYIGPARSSSQIAEIAILEDQNLTLMTAMSADLLTNLTNLISQRTGLSRLDVDSPIPAIVLFF